MVELVIEARQRDLGGFVVGRLLPSMRRRMVGPFIFLDHFDTRFPPGHGLDVRPHPHIGLATVTYLFEGEILHRDGLGSRQPIQPGAVNWMIAGRGVCHSERSPDAERASGGALHGLQAWVALPREREEDAPSFSHHPQEALPSGEERGARWRLIAGTTGSEAAPVRTCSPLFYVAWELEAGARAMLPREHAERAAYVVSGTVSAGGVDYPAGRLLVFARGDAALTARTAARVVVLGGEPVGERHIWWNYVSSRRERLDQAKADWKAGRIPLPPDDDREFIPLPEEEPRPAPQAF